MIHLLLKIGYLFVHNNIVDLRDAEVNGHELLELVRYPDREAHTLYPNGIPMTALIVWVSEVF